MTAADTVRFNWIYDIRRASDGAICVLDSRNFAVRVIDPPRREVTTIAGDGAPGYAGDGGPAHDATFGGDPSAEFDGPWSLSLDEAGNVYIGDRYNRVVRMIDARTGIISTIAGDPAAHDGRPNVQGQRDPLRQGLPQITSMDYADRRLFVPTDLPGGCADVIILRKD